MTLSTQVLNPADAARRDLMRQLQAWWNAHAYYPRHASDNDEVGTAKVHLARPIQPGEASTAS